MDVRDISCSISVDGRQGYKLFHVDGRQGYKLFHVDGRQGFKLFHVDGRQGFKLFHVVGSLRLRLDRSCPGSSSSSFSRELSWLWWVGQELSSLS